MSLTIELSPELEAMLNETAEREARPREEIAAAWMTKGASVSEELCRFDQGMRRLRKTIEGVGSRPYVEFTLEKAYDE